MASSGIYQYLGNDNEVLATVKWEIVSQDAEKLTSTIKLTWTGDMSDITGDIEDYDDYVNFYAYANRKQVVMEHSYTDATDVSGSEEFTITHNADGSFGELRMEYYWGNMDYTRWSGFQVYEVDPIPLIPTIKTASNFTDEENPVITYYNQAGNNATALEACISLTGAADDIEYRSISKTGSSYTFNLTEDERNVLRKAAVNAQTIQVRFYLRITVAGERYFTFVTRNFTVVNCNPILDNPTVREVNSTASELTGDENVFIKHYSMVEFGFEPIASKLATITSQYVQCGSKKVTGLNYGVIDDPESGTFIFSATDSRGLTTERVIEKPIIDYVKPTCNQSFETEIVGETGASISLTISGNYFNGTFGAVRNSLKVEVRFTDNDGVMSEWTQLIVDPRFNGNTYEVDVTFTGFDYTKSYTFQSRVIDELYTVESSQYTVRLLPVFDWSQDDFNFNVPVNINGETVLRHTGSTTNNTVLSASGGHIYIRPGGTSDTSSEIRITPQGDMYLKGDIYINGVSLTQILTNAGLM